MGFPYRKKAASAAFLFLRDMIVTPSATTQHWHIEGVQVKVTRRKAKRLRLWVVPPQGEVRLTLPKHTPVKVARAWLQQHLPWVRTQQAQLAASYPSDMFCLFGEPWQIEWREGCKQIDWDDVGRCLCLTLPAQTDETQRAALLAQAQKEKLHAVLVEMLPPWQARLVVTVNEWRIRRMRTRWGSCNPRAGRIWLSLALVSHPLPCIEYVLVHELLHLLEPSHNAHFKGLLDESLPDWRVRQAGLRG